MQLVTHKLDSVQFCSFIRWLVLFFRFFSINFQYVSIIIWICFQFVFNCIVKQNKVDFYRKCIELTSSRYPVIAVLTTYDCPYLSIWKGQINTKDDFLLLLSFQQIQSLVYSPDFVKSVYVIQYLFKYRQKRSVLRLLIVLVFLMFKIFQFLIQAGLCFPILKNFFDITINSNL